MEIVFDAVRGRIEEQDARFGSLEGKATFTLGAASVLTGGIGTLTVGLATFSGKDAKPMEYLEISGRRASLLEIATGVIILIFAAYLFVIYSTYQALKLRDYHVAAKPEILEQEDLFNPPEVTQRTLINAMVIAFKRNVDVIEEKARWTNWALKGLGMEAALALVVGVIQLWMV